MQTETGGWLQMRPNLMPLLARVADILRQEGDYSDGR